MPAFPGVVTLRTDLDDGCRSETPERYFKLVHRLVAVPDGHLPPEATMRELTAEDADAISALIAASYESIHATPEEIRSWVDRPVHDPYLWLGAFVGEALVGAVIADRDHEVGEVSLDWVQVHPHWHRRGIGRALVCEALRRSRLGSDFATVSGDVENETGPEYLYRTCGFEGDVVWHIYRED